MRIFLINDRFTELEDWPATLPTQGFLWVTFSRRVFEVQLAGVQMHLQRLAGGGLMDLHVSDLLNPQLPSQYDYTSWYDMLVFRRLAAGPGTNQLFLDDEHGTASSARQALAAIDTSPVGFAVFDRVLLTVHPADCSVRDFFETRLSQMAAGPAERMHPASEPPPTVDDDPHLSADATLMDPQELASLHGGHALSHIHRTEGRGPSRLPPSPADLMLRIVNHMV
ncbi:MAG TPA: hypothetical protein VEQ09_11610, partial [Aquabacterium sp.]|nr:hypothetical protein [Aquabacterium sp.]